MSTWTDCLRSWTGSVNSPSAWTVQSNLTQTKARRKKIGSEKKLHQKMRRLKAQPMGMFSGKSQTPHDSPYLPDSATTSDFSQTLTDHTRTTQYKKEREIERFWPLTARPAEHFFGAKASLCVRTARRLVLKLSKSGSGVWAPFPLSLDQSL